MACTCGTREAWRVQVRMGNFSAFNGYRFTPSDYSSVCCEREHGGCSAFWRTKAKYVGTLPNTDRSMGYRDVESGGKGTRTVVAPTHVGRRSILEPYKPPLTCARCGKPGGPLLGPITASRLGTLYHRDQEACRA